MLSSLYPLGNFTKQNEVIAELKQKEATIIRKMQQNPKDFDPKKLKIQIECPQPENIAAGIGFHIKNEQSVIQPPVQNISQPIQSIKKEPFQISCLHIIILFKHLTKLMLVLII